MAATIAGQATMAINARAINRLCIAVSYFGSFGLLGGDFGQKSWGYLCNQRWMGALACCVMDLVTFVPCEGVMS
jgi:hypothetical protein